MYGVDRFCESSFFVTCFLYHTHSDSNSTHTFNLDQSEFTRIAHCWIEFLIHSLIHIRLQQMVGKTKTTWLKFWDEPCCENNCGHEEFNTNPHQLNNTRIQSNHSPNSSQMLSFCSSAGCSKVSRQYRILMFLPSTAMPPSANTVWSMSREDGCSLSRAKTER